MPKNKSAINFLLCCLLWSRTAYCGRDSKPILTTPAPTSTLTCSVDVSQMNFGSYNALNTLSLPASASINVTCSATTAGTQVAYQIKLSAGNSGNCGTRQMTNGSNALNYNIYKDLNYQNILGDGTSGTQLIVDGYTIVQIQNYVKNYAIYGSIPPQQSAPPGSYSDNMTVTVNF